jgi:hypothetical protein
MRGADSHSGTALMQARAMSRSLRFGLAVATAASFSWGVAKAQDNPPSPSLTSLIAQGFEIKTGAPDGRLEAFVVVVQKKNEVFACTIFLAGAPGTAEIKGQCYCLPVK